MELLKSVIVLMEMKFFLRAKDSAILYWSHDDAEGDWHSKEETALFMAYIRVEYLQ